MSAPQRQSVTAMAALILFGLLALFAGEKWLVILIPAAVAVWYGAVPALRKDRN